MSEAAAKTSEGLQNPRSKSGLSEWSEQYRTPRMKLGKRHVSQDDQADECKTALISHQLDQQVAAQTQNPIRAELLGDDQCSANGIVARGYAPVLELCRQLIADGYDASAPMQVYRGSTLALHVSSIGTAAASEINSKGTGLVGLSPVRRGPPVRQTQDATPLAPKGAD